MSVYTVIERCELEQHLTRFEVGELVAFEGIDAGIENTNYFVTTTTGEFVLTLFEFMPHATLPFFLELTAHLSARAVACACPIADRQGTLVQHFKAKPAALVQRLRGSSIDGPQRTHCTAIGCAIGTMHQAARSFTSSRANDRGHEWRKETAAVLLPVVPREEAALLTEEIAFLRASTFHELPSGIIHSDLFRDNALFDGDELTGIIDFYYAHDGALIYDLAVTVADWCFDSDGGFDAVGARAVLDGYDKVRPIEPAERAAWSTCVRAAGVRFWMSRLKDQYFPRPGHLTHTKDPTPFKKVCMVAREQAARLDAVWH